MPLTHVQPDALARIYASSLFELAGKGDNEGSGSQRCESVLGELEDLLELARQNPQFGEFLASQILPAKKRASSINNMLKGRVSDLVRRFLLVLNDKDRLSHLPAIAAAFEQMVQSAYGRIEVDVYTPAPIDQHELATIHDRLKAVLGKEPVLHNYTEPAMIGGLKLQIGDQLIDASVQTQLRKLRDKLSTTGSAQIRASASSYLA